MSDDDLYDERVYTGGDSLEEARAWMRGRFKEGVQSICPCCKQLVKRYARTINGTMLKALGYIYRNPGATTRQILLGTKSTGDGGHAKLRAFGLVREYNDGWICTDLGVRFLEGTTTVPRYAYWYNGEIVGLSIEQISYADVMGAPFDMDEVAAPDAGTPDPVVAPM